MDKQIIIDDVDINECEYCLKMTKYRCTIQRDVYKCLCEENPNCHYKQLKRKEQECEELKEDRERWKSNFNGKVSAIEGLLHQLDQLKQTLAKIKEIAEKRNYLDYNECLDDILQKISECEVEDE